MWADWSFDIDDNWVFVCVPMSVCVYVCVRVCEEVTLCDLWTSDRERSDDYLA